MMLIREGLIKVLLVEGPEVGVTGGDLDGGRDC